MSKATWCGIITLVVLLAGWGRVGHATTLTDNGNGTVTDSRTGLVWQQGEGGQKNWGDALTYCEGLSLGGADNWRLPNVKELESLTDDTRYKPALDTTYFPNVASSYYWSSTADAVNPDSAWDVSFNVGNVTNYNKSHTFYVRCVRGGQSGALGSLVISPVAKEFGAITTGTTSASQTFTLSNSGGAEVKVSSISLTGDSSQFTLDLGTCGAAPKLAANGSCTVSAAFAPTASGAKATTLRVTSDAPATPTKDIPLTGTGVVQTYTIGTSVVGGNGTITCDSPVEKGATSNCAITPATGYHLATFTDNSANKLASVKNNSYSIANVTADHSISGSFEKTPEFAITITSAAQITASAKGGKGTIAFTFTGNATAETISTLVSASDWITTATPKIKGNSGTIAYIIAANTGKARTGTIKIGDNSISVSQDAPLCKITAATAAAVPAAAGTVTINVTVDHDFCTWSAASIKAGGEVWLTDILNKNVTGSGSITGTVAANSSGKARTTAVNLVTGDGKSKKSVTIKQAK